MLVCSVYLGIHSYVHARVFVLLVRILRVIFTVLGLGVVRLATYLLSRLLFRRLETHDLVGLEHSIGNRVMAQRIHEVELYSQALQVIDHVDSLAASL